MNSGIFHIRDGELVEMREEAYNSEDRFQSQLADYPSILAGDQVKPDSPRRWLLVKREMGVPDQLGGSDRWSLDHLFLDQDGVPTLVEIKRSTDTRIRREVVAQLLEYAANARKYWPIKDIQERFEATCIEKNKDPQTELSEFLGADGSTDEFWLAVARNIASEKLRLLFVADRIPTELQRIVEFLNEQMANTEVLAIEIRQYLAETPSGPLRTLIPRVLGQTVKAQDAKRTGKTREWEEEDFYSELTSRLSPEVAEVARTLLGWAAERGLRVVPGEGNLPSYTASLDHGGTYNNPFSIYATGRIELKFQHLLNRPQVISRENVAEFVHRLNSVEGITLPDDAVNGYPSVKLESLTAAGTLQSFLNVLDWWVTTVRRADGNFQQS